MHMETGQSTLMEAFMPRSLGRNPRLDRISRIIDWRPLGEIVNDIHSARKGRPSYPPLAMVKILLLQQWYNLSDPQMEEALADRLSFRRFVGLGLEDDTPDHSTISRFRSALGSERSERLFEEIAKTVRRQGDDSKGRDADGRDDRRGSGSPASDEGRSRSQERA